MKIVNMKRTAADKKAQSNKYKTLGGPDSEDYAYGHRISLDDEHIQKLGLGDSIKDGDPVHVVAHGKVTSSSSNSRNGKAERRIEIQLHRMGVEKTAKKASLSDAIDDGIKNAKAED